ncbi:MAG TPA: hypothetical protein PKD55_05880 [Bellilinea sp.]|nr:hypothetical protein [Bellilinea sp.]
MKKGLLFVMVWLVIIFGLSACAKPKIDSPLVGSWTAIKYEAAGMALDAEDIGESTLEIKSDGKVTAIFMGEGGNGSWKETDSGMVLKTGEEEIPLSYVKGQLVLDYEGMIITYQKDGVAIAPSETAEVKPTDAIPTEGLNVDPAHIGVYGIISAVQDGKSLDYGELKKLGLHNYYVELKEDGTCVVRMDSTAACHWKTGVINADATDEVLEYAVNGDVLTISMDKLTIVYSKGERSDVGADGADLTATQAKWNGTWYGYMWVTTGSGKYADYTDL